VDKDEFEKVQEIVAGGIEAAGLDEIVLSDEESAAKRLADAVSDDAVDRMIADAKESGLSLLDGPDGLIGQLTARIIAERSLREDGDDAGGAGAYLGAAGPERDIRTSGSEEGAAARRARR
jgi:hypothetical protein